MSNNSASGGYLVPSTTTMLPGGLTLVQFLQGVLVGISGFAGTLVRPRWQQNPPKQPQLSTDWLAFGITRSKPSANAYVWMDSSGNQNSFRHEELEIQCSIYGPNCFDNADLIRDGFQITQNLEALTIANMGFVEIGEIIHLPELINEQFVDRVEMTIIMNRQIQRTYPIVNILSATGTVTAIGSETFTEQFSIE